MLKKVQLLSERGTGLKRSTVFYAPLFWIILVSTDSLMVPCLFIFLYPVRAGRTEYAFTLAETYKDFHALSGLSYHPSAEKMMAAKDRIQGYINRFRGDFASQLYQWYIEQGFHHFIDIRTVD